MHSFLSRAALIASLTPVGIASPYLSADEGAPMTELSALKETHQAALAGNPDDLDTLLQLAAIEEKLSDEPSMLSYLDQAIQAHPDSWRPRLAKGRYYLSQRKPQAAVDVLDPIYGPQLAEIQVISAVAAARIQAEDYDGAIQALERMAWLAPQSVDVFYQLARAYGTLGNPAFSESALERTLALDGSHFEARVAMGRMQLLKGDPVAAKKHYERLMTDSSDHPDVVKLGEAITQATR